MTKVPRTAARCSLVSSMSPSSTFSSTVVSRQLGHARPSITLDRYSHLFDRARHATTSAIGLRRPSWRPWSVNADKALTRTYAKGGREASLAHGWAMERAGIEPATSGLQSRRSPS
jgi:hypothetical protein